MAGLLMSYGPNIGWMYRAGGFIGQILKGAKPAGICVQCESPEQGQGTGEGEKRSDLEVRARSSLRACV